MKQISGDRVTRWARDGQSSYVFPVAIDTECPACRRASTLTVTASGAYIAQWKAGDARCVRCTETSKLFMLPPDSGEHPILYLYPHPGVVMPPELSALDEDEFPAPLRAAYASTKRVLTLGEPVAAHVSARRVLEGICWALLPNGQARGKLVEQLEALTAHRQLGADMAALLAVLRRAGNLGAHFDHRRTPTVDSAEAMVSLLDFLIESLYVMPSKVGELEKAFSHAAAAEEQSSDNEAEDGEDDEGNDGETDE